MKIIYPRVCGIDVHKKFIVAVICISESVEPVYLKKRFSTFNNDLIRFRDWLIQNECQNVCMESTGKYYILSTIYWNPIFPISSLPTLNGYALLKARKMTIKMPNGLLIYLSLVLLEVVLYLKKISASFANSLATSTNL